MKNSIFLFCGLLFFASCQSEQAKMKADVEAFEKEVEAQPDAKNGKALLEKYTGYVAAYPNDHETDSRFLYRAASLQYRMNRFSMAIKLLQQALKDHFQGSNSPNNALLLASIYNDKLKNDVGASAVYQAVLLAFPENEKAETIKKDYGDLPPLDDRILDFGNHLMNDSTHRINYRVANDFIGMCEIHALLLPDNEKSPDYLHKAGETARSIRSFRKALEIYDWIYTKYPDNPKAPQALFLKGFTYDNDLKNLKKAKAVYEEFLQKYPNDDFADDTKFLLENLGKKDEEIINSFGEKQ